MNIGKYTFTKICCIKPEQNDDGSIVEYMPQSRYKNEKILPLNKYGAGPFCKFRIPKNNNLSGVYAITVDEYIVYIGECEGLSNRFNWGYGHISPKNCYTNLKRQPHKLILNLKSARIVLFYLHDF